MCAIDNLVCFSPEHGHAAVSLGSIAWIEI